MGSWFSCSSSSLSLAFFLVLWFRYNLGVNLWVRCGAGRFVFGVGCSRLWACLIRQLDWVGCRACGPACSVSCASWSRLPACCLAVLRVQRIGLLLFISCVGAVWAPLQSVLFVICFPPGPGWVRSWLLSFAYLFGRRSLARLAGLCGFLVFALLCYLWLAC